MTQSTDNSVVRAGAAARRALLCVLCSSALAAGAGRVMGQGAEIRTEGGAGEVTRFKVESGSATEEAYFLNVNLGIGTSAPGGYRLVLKEAASAGGNGMKIENLAGDKSSQFWVGTGGAVYDAEGTTNLHLRTGGTDRLFIENATGEIGIGTTAPSRQLDVTGNVKINNAFLGDVGHGATWAGFSHDSIPGTGTYGLLQSSDANYTLLNKASGAGWIGMRVNNADMMVVRETGNVGIGTTTAPSPLTVAGSAYVATAMTSAGTISIKDAAPQINFDDTDNNDWAIHVNSNKMYFIRQAWSFTDLVLDGAGNVGIGDDAPNSKLCIHGAFRTNDQQVYLRGHGDNNHGYSYQTGPPDGPQFYGWDGITFEDRNGGTSMLCNWDTGGLRIGPNLIESTAGSGTVRLRDADGGEIWFDYVAGSGGSDLRVYSTVNPSKDFVIAHPKDRDRYLVHGCLEGPEAAVFYRGTGRLTDGRAEIVLPHYFEALTREEGRDVQVTPEFEDEEPVSALAAAPVRGGRFAVRALDGANPAQAFSWEVKAVRKDVPRLLVEPDRDDVIVEGIGPYRYYREKRISLYPE